MQNFERRRNEYLLRTSCYRSDFRPGASLHEEEALKNYERRHEMKPKKETEIELDPKTAALLDGPAARQWLEKEHPSLVAARDQAIVELRREKLQKETAEKPHRVARVRR